MSNKQNSTDKIIDEWQKHMQEYLNDPRIAELMMDYYAKFQTKVQDVAKEFSAKDNHNASNDGVSTDELVCRIESLETRIELLEKLLGRIFK